jgi:hypothetical protein
VISSPLQSTRLAIGPAWLAPPQVLVATCCKVSVVVCTRSRQKTHEATGERSDTGRRSQVGVPQTAATSCLTSGRLSSNRLTLPSLQSGAVQARYPGDWPDATVQDAERAAVTALAVHQIVSDELGRRGIQPT